MSIGGTQVREGINVYRFANRIPLLFETGIQDDNNPKKSLKILKYIGFSFFFNLSEMDFFLCIPLAERLLESYELLNRPTSAAVAAHTDMFLFNSIRILSSVHFASCYDRRICASRNPCKNCTNQH